MQSEFRVSNLHPMSITVNWDRMVMSWFRLTFVQINYQRMHIGSRWCCHETQGGWNRAQNHWCMWFKDTIKVFKRAIFALKCFCTEERRHLTRVYTRQEPSHLGDHYIGRVVTLLTLLLVMGENFHKLVNKKLPF